MISKIRNFFALSPRRRRLLGQAVWSVVRAWMSLRMFPLKRTTDTLGHSQNLDHLTKDKTRIEEAMDVGRTVELVAKNLPWEINCLPQAIAVKWMLQQRGIPCTVYFGARDARRADGSLDAHAWVTIGNRVIIGGAESKELKPISVFS